MVQINDPSIPTQTAPTTPPVPPERIAPGQIAPEQIALGQSTIDSEAITEDAIAADFDGGDSGLLRSPGEQDRSHNPSPFAGQAPPREDPASISPAVAWQSGRTIRSRQIALIATLAITSLVVAAAIFGWFVSAWLDQPASPPIAVANINQNNVSDPADSESDNRPVQDPDETRPMLESDLKGNAQSDASPAANPESQSELTDYTQPSDIDETPISTIPDDLLQTSPIERELEPKPTPATDDGPSDNLGATELPPEFAKYTQILPVDGALDKPSLEAPPTIDDIELEEAATDDEFELSEAKPRALNLRRDLATRMAISTESYPLADLLLMAGQLTTVPLEIDWVAFDIAGIETAAEVTAPVGLKSARELIDELAASLDCQWKEEETLLVLTPTDMRISQAIESVVDMADFGDSKASAVTTLNGFLRPDADAPNTGETTKKLQIAEDPQEQRIAALSVEAFRQMRGLEAKIPEPRLKRWAAPHQNLKQSSGFEWPLLAAGKTGSQIDAPISVAGLLLDIARRNQTTCLVNWHDLNRRGIGPETLHFPAIKANAGSTLNDAMSRWDIQVRSAGEGHWWIGSQSTYDRLPVLTWTATLGDQRTSVSERIQIVQTANPGEDIRIAIDRVSDKALLKMPRYIAHQLSKILPAP